MWIWVCGPVATGAAGPDERHANLAALNAAALRLFRMGHVPLVGANMALPIAASAGIDEASREIRGPLSMALLERCDACLRIGGPSDGADREVARFVAAGKPVFRSPEAVPPDGPRQSIGAVAVVVPAPPSSSPRRRGPIPPPPTGPDPRLRGDDGEGGA